MVSPALVRDEVASRARWRSVKIDPNSDFVGVEGRYDLVAGIAKLSQSFALGELTQCGGMASVQAPTIASSQRMSAA